MSYSFTVRAKTKDEAKAKTAEAFDAVVHAQPGHSVDRDAGVAAANAFIDIVTDPVAENDEIQVVVNGSLSWREEGVYTGAEMTVRAYMRSTL